MESPINNLPISKYLSQIKSYLSYGNNLVVQAETGAGKSTALPLSLINEDWLAGKKIIMLEPRRVAAKAIAHYLASQLGEKVGETIGYQVKNDRSISKNTILEIVTEGILTRRLQSDPELCDIALIIFDEFHERSLHADLSLMLALEVQQTIRDDLKLMVISATIDTDLISNYLDNAPVIKCEGRMFPVITEYEKCDNNDQGRNSNYNLCSSVTRVLKRTLSLDNTGDTLVFLPGKADINRAIAQAQKEFSNKDILFLPMHGALSLKQQEQALNCDPKGRKRVIFSTNIAQTSLTIDNIGCVIDSGLEKTLIYDPISNMTRLETAYISKGDADQRKGRAGRLQKGLAIRLWSESKHASLKEHSTQEVLTSDLSSFVLNLYVWGLKDFTDINWLTAPPIAHFNSAKNLLIELGFITEKNMVTHLGNKATKLGVEPRIAAMLLKADELIEKEIACELAALMGEKDIFCNNRNVDIVERLIALQDLKRDKRKTIDELQLNSNVISQLVTTVSNLRKALKLTGSSDVYSLEQLHLIAGRSLFNAYPDRLAKRRELNSGKYQLANGKGVSLFDDDPLFNSPWLLVSDCDGLKSEGRIYSALSIDQKILDELITDQLVIEKSYRLDEKKAKIIGQQISKYMAITIGSKPITNIPADTFHKCLNDLLKKEGLKLLNWTAKCEAWTLRANWLGKYVKDFPTISKDLLTENINNWLVPYITDVKSIAGLKNVNILELIKGTLTWQQQQFLEKEAPVQYLSPNGKKLKITYDQIQGPIVSVQLQEMFGELKSPKLGSNAVPLKFILLSPAQRVIQTTSDLESFWNGSYFELAKEMRGKYPKHRWPEKPLLEKPGRSIKPKN